MGPPVPQVLSISTRNQVHLDLPIWEVVQSGRFGGCSRRAYPNSVPHARARVYICTSNRGQDQGGRSQSTYIMVFRIPKVPGTTSNLGIQICHKWSNIMILSHLERFRGPGLGNIQNITSLIRYLMYQIHNVCIRDVEGYGIYHIMHMHIMLIVYIPIPIPNMGIKTIPNSILDVQIDYLLLSDVSIDGINALMHQSIHTISSLG